MTPVRQRVLNKFSYILGYLFVIGLAGIVFLSSGFAQNRDTRRPAPQRPAGASVTAPRPTVSVPRTATTSPSARPTSRNMGSPPVVSSAPRPRPDEPSRPSGGGGGGTIVQTYSPTPYFSDREWYRCNFYLAFLHNQYESLPVGEYLWRYAQGDSPLTPESVQYALRDASNAATVVWAASEELLLAIDRFERGDMSQEIFESLVRVKADEIRDYAKKIRKDDFLDYLDQRKTKAEGSYDKARSLAELRELVEGLRSLAVEMKDGIKAFGEGDMTRTVAVDHLQQPNFDSLSKQVDKLAKVIEKSSKDL